MIENRQFRYKMCIVLRADLEMSIGKLISQACHAAVEVNEQAKKQDHKAWRAWKEEGARKVALQAHSLEEFETIMDMAEELNIVNVLIRDAGLTEIPPGSVTALGLGPDLSKKMDKVTGSFPLLK
jgi:PTH2 family peptidyl-tRNA hydrolase